MKRTMINPKLDRAALSRAYRRSRRIVIPDFLDKAAAQRAHKALVALDRARKWRKAREGDPSRPGEFAYRYGKYPLRDITRGELRRLARFLGSVPFNEWLRQVTGRPIEDHRVALACTRFGPGDLMSVHRDGPSSRKLAFILHLTHDWPVHWGGQFVITDPSGERVLETVSPAFNTLVLFDVPLDHAVLPVSRYARGFRYAISGWFSGKNRTD